MCNETVPNGVSVILLALSIVSSSYATRSALLSNEDCYVDFSVAAFL